MASGPVLIAGGAGYIGSCCARLMKREGFDVVVLDDMSAGHEAAVEGLPLVRADIADRDAVKTALAHLGGVESVILFASFTSVPESVKKPQRYYANNLAGAMYFIETMVGCGVRRLVFSSSASVYGPPDSTPIPEDAPKRPISPYGRIKWQIEEALRDFRDAGMLDFAALRYFNAAGAEPDGSHGEDHHPETHLIPLAVAAALGRRPPLKVFGTDYDTPDGSCLRDYVHVRDLAKAHVAALTRLGEGDGLAYNVGTAKGFSVLEVIEAVSRTTGKDVPFEKAQRREGDPPRLVASSALIREELGWEPEFDLHGVVRTAVDWHTSHPDGYGDRRE